MHTLLHSSPQHWPTPPLKTPGHSWASLVQSPVGSLFLPPGSGAHKLLFVPSKSLFPQSCVSSGGSMVGLTATSLCLCYNQVYCTQSPCPCSSPLLTCTSTRDTQTQFCLSLCGVSGSWCAQGMFEPSECLWQEWGLILNLISLLLPSRWGFSFVLGHRIFPQSCSSTMQLLLHHK